MCRGTSACGKATRFSGKSGSWEITVPGLSGVDPFGVVDDEPFSAAGGRDRGLWCAPRPLWGTPEVCLPLVDGLSADAEGSAGSCARMFGAQRPRRRIDIDVVVDRWVVSLALVAKEVAAAALRALAEEAIVNDETRTSVDEKERKA